MSAGRPLRTAHQPASRSSRWRGQYRRHPKSPMQIPRYRGAGSGPNDADLWHGGRVVAVEQDRQSTQTRNDLAQQLEPLAGEIDILARQASKIAAGPRQTSDQIATDRV